MSKRLDRYKYVLDMRYNDWCRLIANPYVMAYDTAFESYKKHTELQREADKERAEMFVMAASIVTGTIFMATVASTSMRLLARRSALAALGRRNLQLAFNAAKAAKNSEPFMFAVGKLLDEGKSQVNKLVQAQVKDLVSSNINVVSDTSMVQSTHLDTILRNHLACGYKCGLAIEDSRTLSEADKEHAFTALRQAAICNPPQVRIDVAKLAAKIELCMYMKLILDSDRLVTRPAQPADREGRMAAVMMSSSRPIDKSPFATDYPQSTSPKRIGMMNSSYQVVEINRPGSILRNRIDAVYQVAFKMPFYSKKGDLGVRELRVAENTLRRLARETRPMNISDLKN